MTATAQAGIFSFGPQEAKGTEATEFFRHRALDVDLGGIDDVRLGPPEVGGIPVPTFPYKAGLMATGGATLQPRLIDSFGWLLYGVMGAADVNADEDVEGDTVAGLNTHVFTFATEAGFVPYMSFRKLIPNDDPAKLLGETFLDGKIVGLTFTLGNDAPITARVDAICREYGIESPDAWADENEFEDWQSIPVGCVLNDAYIQVPGFDDLAVVNATVTMTNTPLDIRQEKIYGSPYIEDVTIIQRALTFDLTAKWKDPDLYRTLLTGAADGTSWVPKPYTAGLDITGASTGPISEDIDVPYRFRIQAPSVLWRAEGPVRLAGGQAIMMRLIGTALDHNILTDPLLPFDEVDNPFLPYATISIQNEVATYDWPVPGP